MRTINLPVSPLLLSRYLLIVTAAILDVLAIGSLMRISDNPDMGIVYAIYAFLMFADAAALLVCGLWLNRQKAWVYWLAVVVLSLNIVLTIFDQFGVIDFLFVTLNAITLSFLLAGRKQYFLP